MFNRLHFKKIHLVISVFVLLNISLIAFLAIGNIGKPVVVSAAPNCQLPSNLTTYSATHNASIQINIKTSSPSVALPALALSLHTAQCTDGYDNGFAWNSGYNTALQDPWIQSPQITPGRYITPAQIASYYNSNHTPPTTYQVMPPIGVGQSQGNGTVFSCPQGFGLCSSEGGNITRTNTVSSGTVTQSGIKYYATIDCNFSPVSYSISGLPSGWTVSGNNATVQVQNGYSVTETITVTPPAPVTPTIKVSLNCQGASWTTTNFQSGDAVAGYVEDTTTTQDVFNIPKQTSASGVINSFVSSLTNSQNNYEVVMSVFYANNGNATATSNSFNFYNCVTHTQAPVISVTLNCQGATWSTTNYVSSDAITGYITDTTTGAEALKIPTQNTGTGVYNSFVQSLENSHDNYTATMSVQSGNTATTSAVSFYNCVKHPPVISSVSLACVQSSVNMAIQWQDTTSSLVSGDTFYGTIEDTTTNTQAATFSVSASLGSYTWTGANATDNYTVSGYIEGSNGKSSVVTSSSENIKSCQAPVAPAMTSISLACQNNTSNDLLINWKATNVPSGEMFTGIILDTTTGTEVATVPNTNANLGAYIWQGSNGKDSYQVSGWLINAGGAKTNVMTTSSVSGDCVPAPVTQTVQQLPQTAGTSPIEMFAAVGGLIIAIGVGLMML
jgi:hypothetical protein